MEKLRVIYSKSKEAIYLSHLDVSKVFQQALIRADMSVEYSKLWDILKTHTMNS